ncbi:amidohydrolase family protein [Mesorhizobium sp. WSM4887]|uniref:amidohydrolase family protein n=1 Tax=Mesorhizobium sp. WSM4887 TaxID=3038543 RepID=UPI0024167C4E|nr:amidohydrolase family protein [Mesorhizobium sp. WSM4887]MDG4889756.1 amidohydrolase family protein [Mesorhizobium sp. WSM4887]
MPKTLTRGRYVFTRPEGRHDWTMLEDAAVLHSNGVIEAVGDFAALRDQNPTAEIVGDGTQVVLPGFVNAHHHVGLTPLQLGVPDLPLELWSNARVKFRNVDPYLDTLYSAFELIGSGVTTVQHLRGAQFGGVADVLKASDAVVQAYEDVGLRVSMGMGLRDQNRMHHQMADDDFVASLPEEIRPGARRHLDRFGVGLDNFFDLYTEMERRYAGKPLVRMQLAPLNLHWMTDRSIEMHADFQKRTGALIHLHLDETQHQKEYARRRGGGSAVEYLDRFGFLSDKLTLGHGVWLNESDLETLSAKGVHVCTNCSSNFRLRSGIAPLNAFECKQMNVAIGIDEAGINDDRDMFQEMRMVLNAHRVPGVEDGVPTVGQVLRMATVGGALTTPFGLQIGKLVPGAFADMTLVNWKAIARPYLDQDTPVLSAVLHRAKPQAVDAVIINGRVVYEDGRFTLIDRDAILARLEEQMSRPLTEFEQDLRQTSAAILPHVKAFYKGYVTTEHVPYYKYNSKK